MSMSALLAALLSLPVLDDRPPAFDVDRFPPLAIVLEARSQATTRLIHYQYRAGFYSGDPAGRYEVLSDAKWRYDCWDWLHWAHTQGDPARRDALATLRSLLGPEAFYSALMPE